MFVCDIISSHYIYDYHRRFSTDVKDHLYYYLHIVGNTVGRRQNGSSNAPLYNIKNTLFILLVSGQNITKIGVFDKITDLLGKNNNMSYDILILAYNLAITGYIIL